MAAPIVLGAAALAGTAISTYGSIKSASDQAAAQEREAALKNLQANELEQRQAINERIMQDKELEFESSTGSDRGGGSLGQIMAMRKNLFTNLETSRREANWKVRMLRMGAASDLNLSSDAQAAGYITGAGTILTGAQQAYTNIRSALPPSANVASLPKVEL